MTVTHDNRPLEGAIVYRKLLSCRARTCPRLTTQSGDMPALLQYVYETQSACGSGSIKPHYSTGSKHIKNHYNAGQGL